MYVGNKGVKTCQCPAEREQRPSSLYICEKCAVTSSTWWKKSFLPSFLKENQFSNHPQVSWPLWKTRNPLEKF